MNFGALHYSLCEAADTAGFVGGVGNSGQDIYTFGAPCPTNPNLSACVYTLAEATNAFPGSSGQFTVTWLRSL